MAKEQIYPRCILFEEGQQRGTTKIGAGGIGYNLVGRRDTTQDPDPEGDCLAELPERILAKGPEEVFPKEYLATIPEEVLKSIKRQSGPLTGFCKRCGSLCNITITQIEQP